MAFYEWHLKSTRARDMKTIILFTLSELEIEIDLKLKKLIVKKRRERF